jgi:RHS repeat-associated protein
MMNPTWLKQQGLAKQHPQRHMMAEIVRLAVLLLGCASASAQAQTQTLTRASSFTYTAQGLLASETIEPDLPQSCLQTSYSYDATGNKIGVSTSTCAGATSPATDSAITARTATAVYAAQTVSINGISYSTPAGLFATSNANALAQTESKEHDPRFGALSKLVGPNGLATSWTYDTFGRKTRETRADATYTSWAYTLCSEAPGWCAAAISSQPVVTMVTEASYTAAGVALSPPTYHQQDAFGRTIRSSSLNFTGQTIAQDKEYNHRGLLVRYSNSYMAANPKTAAWTVQTYDALDRVVSIAAPDPDALATGTSPAGTATSTLAYNGLSSSSSNSKGQTKTTLKNVAGQVASVTDTTGNTVLYRYDALGQLLQTNAAGSITTLVYNQRGQKKDMIDPAMGVWHYDYNVYGELVTQTDSLSANLPARKTTMLYDLLGRMTKRTEPDLISDWSFDKTIAGVACGKSVGKLCEAKADNGYNRKHTYDSLGRAISTATVLDSATAPAVVSETFDINTGRVASKSYPASNTLVYKASYTYDARGYLTKVTGAPTTGTAAQIAAQTLSHEILAINDQGQITSYKTGNNITTSKTIDAATGRLKLQKASLGTATDGGILNHAYTHDSLGNLLTRKDLSAGVGTAGVGTSEGFAYDSLNRLTMSNFTGGAISIPASVQVIYDARGNIAYKSDVGTYFYDPARHNRMTQVTLQAAPAGAVALTGSRALSYAFDDYLAGAKSVTNATGTTIPTGNGNLMYTVTQDTPNNIHTARWETYTSFNMPLTIKYGTVGGTAVAPTTDAQATTLAGTPVQKSLSFVYGPEHQRIKQTTVGGPDAGTTWYLNGEDSLGLTYEKELTAAGVTEFKHYLNAGGMTFAMFTARIKTAGGTIAAPALPTGTAPQNQPYTTSYLHHDQIGSVVAISNQAGVVVERLAYDPWGKRRFTNGTTDKLDAIVSVYSDRGFTMHEHLDEMGVIHMNGRIYDPLIGRFMSADPRIQAPYNLKSFNRYSYVWNNPLKLVDLNGYDATDTTTGSFVPGDPSAPGGTTQGSCKVNCGGGSGGGVPQPPAVPAGTPGQPNNPQCQGSCGPSLVERTDIDGGTPEQREKVKEALQKIENTETGKALNLAIPDGRILIQIKPVTPLNAEATLGQPAIVTISPEFTDSLVCCYITDKGEKVPFTLERVLAHELGHPTGLPDIGTPNNMGNVIKWENPIMREIAPEQPDRGRYFLPPLTVIPK